MKRYKIEWNMATQYEELYDSAVKSLKRLEKRLTRMQKNIEKEDSIK